MIYQLLSNVRYPLVQSVIQKNMDGKIFINKNCKKVLIINNLNWVYVIGDDIDKEFDKEIIYILTENNKGNYIWFGMTKYWEELIRDILKGPIEYFPRLEWNFDNNIFNKTKITYEKYVVEKIEKNNINKVCGGIKNSITDFWFTKENFLDNGFGYYVEHDKKIVGLIISAGIYHDEVEIDIIVDSQYQKQGLGKLLSVTFIENCLKKNSIPKWDCYKYNEGSVKLAKSLGFKVINEYPCNIVKL
ncbi:MAG: GNAT family N-acetyltransferase [Treponema sp.]|jgi:GNAT superfamily N-acetyltransferase|nr:GNAT family N-acetyltransferase [Treponema sp.]